MSDAGSVDPRDRYTWLRLFIGGLCLWAATAFVTFSTTNFNLVPTLVLLGTFLVPVTFVAYAFEHRTSAALDDHTIFIAVVYGGVLGVLGASILEDHLLVSQTLLSYVRVGVVEEACKLGALWLVAWRHSTWLLDRLVHTVFPSHPEAKPPQRPIADYRIRDGVVLGAAVGSGFAALESAGYALNALFTIRGMSLPSLLETQVLRAVLAPVGHGLWTGILGAVLFSRFRNGHPIPTWRLAGWFLAIALLHALWDSAQSLAALIVILVTAHGQPIATGQGGAPIGLTDTQLHLFTILNWGITLLAAALGILALRRLWRRSSPRAAAAAA